MGKVDTIDAIRLELVLDRWYLCFMTRRAWAFPDPQYPGGAQRRLCYGHPLQDLSADGLQAEQMLPWIVTTTCLALPAFAESK